MRHPYFPKGVLEDMADGFNNRWRTMRRAFRNYGSENDWLPLQPTAQSYDEAQPRGGGLDAQGRVSRRVVRITYRFINIMHDALTRVRRRAMKRARDAFTVSYRDDTRFNFGLQEHELLGGNTRRLRTYRIGRTAVPSNWNTAAPEWIRDTYYENMN
jgi:hypothetical protein